MVVIKLYYSNLNYPYKLQSVFFKLRVPGKGGIMEFLFFLFDMLYVMIMVMYYTLCYAGKFQIFSWLASLSWHKNFLFLFFELLNLMPSF